MVQPTVIHIFDIRYNANKLSHSIWAHLKRVFKAACHHSLPLPISISFDLNIRLHKITSFWLMQRSPSLLIWILECTKLWVFDWIEVVAVSFVLSSFLMFGKLRLNEEPQSKFSGNGIYFLGYQFGLGWDGVKMRR